MISGKYIYLSQAMPVKARILSQKVFKTGTAYYSVKMVYCKKCGAKNTDDSVFCGDCGEPLAGKPAESSPKKDAQKNPKHKSPAAAVLLNLLLAGAGFIYLGEWGKAVLFFFLVLVSAAIFKIPGWIFMMALTMIACYNDAKKINSDLQQ